ncbi:hypothetical protein VMCG_10782 [Cytospora schulzeri]|uniref:Uncharacterized protein n=1 Tax=Cytospora schulzeri TaxID=448051 RepID=A0A423V9C8_9PEZI|nr:hypothetical protein VMCG_10782 [Valsa malicola]
MNGSDLIGLSLLQRKNSGRRLLGPADEEDPSILPVAQAAPHAKPVHETARRHRPRRDRPFPPVALRQHPPVRLLPAPLLPRPPAKTTPLHEPDKTDLAYAIETRLRRIVAGGAGAEGWSRRGNRRNLGDLAQLYYANRGGQIKTVLLVNIEYASNKDRKAVYPFSHAVKQHQRQMTPSSQPFTNTTAAATTAPLPKRMSMQTLLTVVLQSASTKDPI